MKIKTMKTRRKKRSRKIPFKGEIFHSKFEIGVFQVLLEYFERSEFSRQKEYHDDRRKHTCDFYFEEHKAWVECSSYTSQKYMRKIEKKRKWIEERGENFWFINNISELKKHLDLFFNK
jgi:hypothetical protein